MKLNLKNGENRYGRFYFDLYFTWYSIYNSMYQVYI
jgi:hypothetical protein